MYEVLGLEGPYQSYLQWKYRLCCWSNWEILDNHQDSVWNKLEFEGIGFESKDNVGFALEYGAYLIEKEDALFRLLSNLADE